MSESDSSKNVKFPLKATVNKQKTRVLFAEVDSSFADILLSFLTLPLGTIVRILQKHYKDEAPSFGSLTTLFKGLSNLDSAKFWTEGAKSILLHPRSSFDAQRKRLKIDISDSPPLEYFVCMDCDFIMKSESMYYDDVASCRYCGSSRMIKEAEKIDARYFDGVFTAGDVSFLITDDLQIMPNKGLMQIVRVLSSTHMDDGEILNCTLGFAEVMDLLSASLISSTPLSDIILKKTDHKNSPMTKLDFAGIASTSTNSKKMNLKLIVDQSRKKLLYAEAGEDFVEFLFGLLIIPLGEVECLLKTNSGIKAIDNLHKSVGEFMDGKYFNNNGAKGSLIRPKIPHGYISKCNILPLTQASMLEMYVERFRSSSVKFPKGQGSYLVAPQTYKVEDDLTVTPFCLASVLSSLKKLKIQMYDVKEVPLNIRLEEGLRILKASLTSTRALTDALSNHFANKR